MASGDSSVPSEAFHTENLFARCATDIPRSDMPRVPGDAEHLRTFTQLLDDRGLGHTIEHVNPTLLHATQSELDGRFVASIASDWDPDRAGMLIVSREGAVLDGNHRWAAACVRRADDATCAVTILRVDAPIDVLLETGYACAPTAQAAAAGGGEPGAGATTARSRLRDASDARAPVILLAPSPGTPRSFASYGAPTTPCPDPGAPYVWVGEWALVATDSSDGVPDRLTFGKPAL